MFFSIQSSLYVDSTSGFNMGMILSFVENMVLFIFLTSMLFIIMATPIYLLYSSVDNYYKTLKKRIHINEGLCCEDKVSHPSNTHKVCKAYISAYQGFLSSVLGLGSWFLFTLIYVAMRSENIVSGLEDYLHFPFDVVEIYHFNDAMNSIVSFESNWLFMLIIYLLTLAGFQIGRYLAPRLAAHTLPKNWQQVSWV